MTNKASFPAVRRVCAFTIRSKNPCNKYASESPGDPALVDATDLAIAAGWVIRNGKHLCRECGE